MTRPPFVRRRLERRDDATEALEEAKEVRLSRAIHGLSKRLEVLTHAHAAMQGRGCLTVYRFTGGPFRRCAPEQPLLADQCDYKSFRCVLAGRPAARRTWPSTASARCA